MLIYNANSKCCIGMLHNRHGEAKASTLKFHSLIVSMFQPSVLSKSKCSEIGIKKRRLFANNPTAPLSLDTSDDLWLKVLVLRCYDCKHDNTPARRDESDELLNTVAELVFCCSILRAILALRCLLLF